MVSNCPRCQIVRGVKLSSLHGRCQIVLFCMMVSNCPRCQIVLGVKLSSLHGRCQIVLGVKLSSVSNCPITVGKWVSAFLLLPLKIFCSTALPCCRKKYSVFVCIFAFSVIAFPNSLSALPLGFVEFSSRIAPMHASSANTFVFKQLDEAALTEKDPIYGMNYIGVSAARHL